MNKLITTLLCLATITPFASGLEARSYTREVVVRDGFPSWGAAMIGAAAGFMVGAAANSHKQHQRMRCDRMYSNQMNQYYRDCVRNYDPRLHHQWVSCVMTSALPDWQKRELINTFNQMRYERNHPYY